MKYIVLFFCLNFFNSPQDISASDLLTFHLLSGLTASAMHDIEAGKLPQELQQYQHQHVFIRGFLYPTKNGEMILAGEPDLKSCCIASQTMITRQVFVKGELDWVRHKGFAVTLEGDFAIDPIRNKNGEWQRLYILKNAVFSANKSGNGFLLFLLVGGGIIAAAIVSFFVYRRKYFG